MSDAAASRNAGRYRSQSSGPSTGPSTGTDTVIDNVLRRERELLAALEAARGELVTVHSRMAESQTLAEGRRIEAAAARRAADDLWSALREARAQRGQAVAELDRTQARLKERERQIRRLTRSLDERRHSLAALSAERDAARAEADRARRQIDALIRDPDEPPPGPVRRGDGDRGWHGHDIAVAGRRHAVEAEDAPAGVHSLNGLRLPRAADRRPNTG